MSETEKKDEKIVEKPEEKIDKVTREPDQIIEIRNTYSAEIPSKKDDSIKVPEKKVETKTEEITKTPEKKVDDIIPQLSVKELQTQLEAEKKKRGELELIVEAEATKQFETEKTAFLALVPDETKRAELETKIGDNPDALNEYKRMAYFMTTMLEQKGVKVTGKEEKPIETTEETSTEETTEDSTEEETIIPVVKGKATLQDTDQVGSAENYKAYVNELYEILNDPSKTVKERQMADGEINKLFGSMVLGIKASKATQHGDMPFLPASWACGNPACGTQLFGDPETTVCHACGWKLYGKGFTPRR